MIRIMLNITHCSPFLQTVSGEVIVQCIDYRENAGEQVKDLLTVEFTKKPGQMGFSNPAGYNAAIFEALKDKLDTMIHSYARGMILAPHDFSWVEDSADVPLDAWLKEKGEIYEKKFK